MRIPLIVFCPIQSYSSLIIRNYCLGLSRRKTVKPFCHSCSAVASSVNMSSLDPKRTIHPAENLSTGPSTISTGEETSNKRSKGKWRNYGRASATGCRGHSRIVNHTTETVPGTKITSERPKLPPRPRPTHFLALPLQNHPELRAAVARFQAALFEPPPESVIGEDNVGSTTSGLEILAVPTPLAKDSIVLSKTAKAKAKARAKATLSPTIQGLDTSILIDPRRLHMTLGVMSLEKDEEEPAQATGVDAAEDHPVIEQLSRLQIKETDMVESNSLPTAAVTPSPLSSSSSPRTPKTSVTALSLLESLKPRITAILDGSKGVDVPLEILDVMKTEKMRLPKSKSTQASETPSSVVPEERERRELGAREENNISSVLQNIDERASALQQSEPKVGAGVLFLGPPVVSAQNQDEELRKLMTICKLVQKTFKDAGYLTDTRPLKLHCTIINASHRKPSRRMPFSYSDILQSPAMLTLIPSRPIAESAGADPSTEASTVSVPVEQAKPEVSKRSYTVPPPVNVNLGKFHVDEIQLWEMGSHTDNNEYVNCGGIVLD